MNFWFGKFLNVSLTDTESFQFRTDDCANLITCLCFRYYLNDIAVKKTALLFFFFFFFCVCVCVL